MRLSPSRGDKYNSCPFSYFVSGGLKIYPRGKAEITPLSSGSLIHKAIEVVVTKYGGKGISRADKDELRAVVAEIVADYISKMEGGRQALTPRNYYLFERLADSIYELAVRLGEEFEQSEFEPIAFEQSIGSDSETPPITLSLPDGTQIQVIGSIDRVDVAEIDGKRYIRVVDYKSGGKKFALTDVYYGLNMQMLIYLFSIWKEGKGKYENTLPAGVLYMPAVAKHFTTDRLDTGEQYMKARNNHYKMNGLLLAEDDVLKAMDAEGGIFIPKPMAQTKNSFASLEELGQLAERVQEQISLMAYRLLKGKIGAKPTISGGRTPCEYCDYKGICGFEDGDPINEKADITREQLLSLNMLEKEVENDV